MYSRFLKKKPSYRPREQDSEYDCESSLLLSTDGKDSDNENSSIGRNLPLHPKRTPLHCIEHTLQPGETLSALALQYNCSVSLIKQANNILRENEIFALRKVRIPVPPISSLVDNVPGVHLSHQNLKKACEEGSNEIHVVSRHFSVKRECLNSEADLSNGLRDPLLTPIPLPKLPLVDLSDSEPPDLQLSSHDVQDKVSDGLFHCSGADCGLSWIALVVCMLVLGFVGPLVYIFFLYEHEQDHKLHNHTNTDNHSST